jgi:hypothetical protein
MMEVVGFIVALVLLIPTYGLSLLLYLPFLIAGGVMRANARMHHANMQQTLRDVSQSSQAHSGHSKSGRPSWFSDKDEVEIFISVVLKFCARKNIPELYVSGLLAQEEFGQIFTSLVAGLERRGSSFIEQQMGAAEFIEAAWNRLSDEDKSAIRIQSEQLTVVHGLNESIRIIEGAARHA